LNRVRQAEQRRYLSIYEPESTSVLGGAAAFLAPCSAEKSWSRRACNAADRLTAWRAGDRLLRYVEQLRAGGEIPAEARPSVAFLREDAIVGAFVQVTLQRMSSAVFDVLDVPIWAEQDAADSFGFLMLQFGEDTARRLLNGAPILRGSDRNLDRSDSPIRADRSGSASTIISAVAYAGQETFSDFVKASRRGGAFIAPRPVAAVARERCPKGTTTQMAFDSTIMPSVDQSCLQKVLERKWLRPDDGK